MHACDVMCEAVSVSEVWFIGSEKLVFPFFWHKRLWAAGLDVFVKISYIDSFVGVDKIYRQGFLSSHIYIVYS